MAEGRIGFIGGSGIYGLPGIEVKEEIALTTPWGPPSGPLLLAELAGREVVFLPRHGRGHHVLPAEVNSRANIAALKRLEVDEVVAFSAVGSLREELKPLDFAVPDQLIDRTRMRPSTFFGHGIVGHVAFADPYCSRLQETINGVAAELSLTMHQGETLVCIDGPTFSTRAESKLYRSWGAGLINMSALPEARLAREAELCYALVCMVTDYDCWRTSTEDVDIGEILANIKKNASNAGLLAVKVVEAMGGERTCRCGSAAASAIITAPDRRNAAQEEKLRYVLGDRLGGGAPAKDKESES